MSGMDDTPNDVKRRFYEIREHKRLEQEQVRKELLLAALDYARAFHAVYDSPPDGSGEKVRESAEKDLLEATQKWIGLKSFYPGVRPTPPGPSDAAQSEAQKALAFNSCPVCTAKTRIANRGERVVCVESCGWEGFTR